MTLTRRCGAVARVLRAAERGRLVWRPAFRASGFGAAPARRFCAGGGGPAEARDAQRQDSEGDLPEDADIPPEVAELFDTLRGEALRRLDEFGPIHLFSLCWAYSTARLLDADLQQQVTGAALRLGAARDEAAARGPGAGGRQDGAGEAPDTAGAASAEPSAHDAPQVVAEGQHWMAIYKPPHWQVSVDSKEAARAAAVAPFADDEDGEAEEADQADAGSRDSFARFKMHLWVKQFLAPRYPICSDPLEAFGLMHRLDAQTSGLLVCAKSYTGAYWIRLQWCSYTVDKEYVCLVHGWVDKSIREIHKRIRVEKRKAPNSLRTVSTHCTVGANGKPSFTELCAVAHLSRPARPVPGHENQEAVEKYSLVVLKLHTGRTHQIRVHMLSIGHPLVTDGKYGEDHFAADQQWCSRNFLHTYRLSFNDVPSGSQQTEPVELCCPLPSDLRSALSLLTPVNEASAEAHAAWLAGDSSRLQPFEAYATARDVLERQGQCADASPV